MRYAAPVVETFVWLFHDTCIHCLTGILGFVGKIVGILPGTGSVGLRLVTIAHHVHNATAPSNDVLADYAHARALACHNETRENPRGSMTPDEWFANRSAARRALGVGDDYPLSEEEFQDAIVEHDVPLWEGQASGNNNTPQETTRTEQLRNRESRRLERKIAERVGADRAFNDKRMLHVLLEALDEFVEAREKHELARVLRRRGIVYTPGSYRARKHTDEE